MHISNIYNYVNKNNKKYMKNNKEYMSMMQEVQNLNAIQQIYRVSLLWRI